MFECFIPEPVENTPSIVHEQIVQAVAREDWEIPVSTIAYSHLDTMNSEALDKDWKLQEFFGTIAVIHLPQANQRLKRITKQLHRVGTDIFDIFPAIDGRKDVPPNIWQKMTGNRDRLNDKTKKGKAALDRVHQGETGCYLSHYNLIKSIKEKFDQALSELNCAKNSNNQELVQKAVEKVRKYSRVLILEDDVGFGIVDRRRKIAIRKGVGRLLRKALSEIPDNWDMLYFLVNPAKPTKPFSPHLRRLRLTSCAAAYAVNHTMYGPLLKQLSKIDNPSIKRVEPVDIAISRIHFLHKVYALNPCLAYHQAGPSQISANVKEHLWQGKPILHKR